MIKKIYIMFILFSVIVTSWSMSLESAYSLQTPGYTFNISSYWDKGPTPPIRQPAEFEPMEGVLICYPFGIPIELISEIAKDTNIVTIVANETEQANVEAIYVTNGISLDTCSFLIAKTNRYWTQDFGPMFIFTGDNQFCIVDFKYSFLFRLLDNAIPKKYAYDQNLTLYNMPLIHEGGNYITDGQGIAVSTNLVWMQNLFRRRSIIEDIANEFLGINQYHIIPDANGYIDPRNKHIDCWAKFLSPDVIMIKEVRPERFFMYFRLEAAVRYFKQQTSCYGTPYKIIRIFSPDDEPYINSLIVNHKVYVPLMGSKWDNEAIDTYKIAMPGYEIHGFRGQWFSADAIHCRIKGIPDRGMLYIEHVPLLKHQQFNESGYTINVKILPYSGQNLIMNSTCVYFKINNSDWYPLPLEHVEDMYYSATIPSQKIGTNISYYIHAEDCSGRMENHPYIGVSWAHFFSIDPTNSSICN